MDDTTNTAAVTAPPSPTPALDKLKSVLAAKDAQIADLQSQLQSARDNGAALTAKVDAMNGTINGLHDSLADYAAVEALLGV